MEYSCGSWGAFTAVPPPSSETRMAPPRGGVFRVRVSSVWLAFAFGGFQTSNQHYQKKKRRRRVGGEINRSCRQTPKLNKTLLGDYKIANKLPLAKNLLPKIIFIIPWVSKPIRNRIVWGLSHCVCLCVLRFHWNKAKHMLVEAGLWNHCKSYKVYDFSRKCRVNGRRGRGPSSPSDDRSAGRGRGRRSGVSFPAPPPCGGLKALAPHWRPSLAPGGVFLISCP